MCAICDDDFTDHEPHHEPHHHHPGRRAVLGGVAAALRTPVLLPGGPASAAAPSQVTGQAAVVAAMHMHASFSEQQGSWDGQARRMVQESVDLLFMTDHSHGLMATGMAADLQGTVTVPVASGAMAQQGASVTSGRVFVLAESAGSQPSSSGVVTDPDAKPNERAIRTSVMGQVLRHTFAGSVVDDGGLYEVRVGLSHHPARAQRPEGVYELCFRFGPALPDRGGAPLLEDGGLTAVVTAPLPPAGTTVDLDLEATCAAAWPDLIPEDNGTQWFSFTALSPRAGVVAAVTVKSVTFERAARTAEDVATVQRTMAERYSRDYGITVVPAIELGSRLHHNAFTPAPYSAPDELLAYSDADAYTRTNVATVHALGGVVSWNHPFGADVGVATTGDAAVARRRAVYSSLARVDVYGADLLEVGYEVRGKMGIDEHLRLWDTFSRQGRFLTGNGVSDSHDSTVDRRRQGNEFVTGVWAASTGMRAVLPALAAGRAFARHVFFWAGGELDLVVDGTILMGQAAIGRPGRVATRLLTITATNLPRDAVVEVVAGPVDYQGVDPGTAVVDTVPAAAFGSNGIADRRVSLPSSSFVRLTVRTSVGAVIGVSNPVWLLDASTPRGIPAGRLHPPQ